MVVVFNKSVRLDRVDMFTPIVLLHNFHKTLTEKRTILERSKLIQPSKIMKRNIIHSCMNVRKRRGFVIPYQILPNKMGLAYITYKFLNGDRTAGVEVSIKNEFYILNLLLPKVHIVTSIKSLSIKIRVQYMEGRCCKSLKFDATLELGPMFILPQKQNDKNCRGNGIIPGMNGERVLTGSLVGMRLLSILSLFMTMVQNIMKYINIYCILPK